VGTLVVRDYLRKHPDEAQRYAYLKRDLAQRFATDQEAYTSGKAEYVQSVMQRARQEFILTYARYGHFLWFADTP